MHSNRKKSAFYLILLFCLLKAPAFSFAQTSDEAQSFKEKKTKEGFLVDLKSLVSRSKEKIEEANEKIEEQELYKRNQQREEKAREYYEKGMRLYEEGKFDKANEFWERAVKITEHPEMKGYVSKSSAKTKKEQKALNEAEKRRLERLERDRGFTVKEVEKNYAQAVSYFKRKKYLNAREKFQQVEDMFPDHKATRSYLMLVNQKITNEQEDLIVKTLEADSENYDKGKENWKSELEKKSDLRRKHLEDQAGVIYEQAVELYKTRQYVSAKEKFKEVEWVLPNYKSTIKYLKKLDREIKVDEVLTQDDKQRLFEKQMREERMAGVENDKFADMKEGDRKKEAEKRMVEEAEFVYKSAVSLYKKNNFLEAKGMFMEVENIYPAYKKTRDYLSKIEKKIPEYQRDLVKVEKEEYRQAKESDGQTVKQEVVGRREVYAQEAEKKYNEALSFYKRNNFVEAKMKFVQVEALCPDFKDTLQYLARIDDDITPQLARGDEKAAKSLEVAWQDKSVAQKASAFSPSTVRTVDAKVLYDQAVQLYKGGQYKLAQDKFLQVNNDLPGYKKTEKYLDKIYHELAKEKKKDIVHRKEAVAKGQDLAFKDVLDPSQFKANARIKYKEALSLYKEKQFVFARKKFVEVNELYPGYKATKRYILRLNKIVPSIYHDEKKEMLAKPSIEAKAPVVEMEPSMLSVSDQAEEHYQEGVKFYKAQDYVQAREAFNKAMGIIPDYKMSSVYLSRIDKKAASEIDVVDEEDDVDDVDDTEDVEEVMAEKSSEPKDVIDYKHRKRDEKIEAKAEAKSDKSFLQSFSKQKELTKKQREEFERQKKMIAKIKQEESKEDMSIYDDKIKALYKEAVSFFKEKQYDLAKKKFNAVDSLSPNYKTTRSYIKQIDRLKVNEVDKERLMLEIGETEKIVKTLEKRAEEGHEFLEEVKLAGMSESSEVNSKENFQDELAIQKQILNEKQTALRWLLDQETRLAELMSKDEELERLEEERYKVFRATLDKKYADEDKLLEESKKRISEQMETLRKEYALEKKLINQANNEADEYLERYEKKTKKVSGASRENVKLENERSVQKGFSFKEEVEVAQISRGLMKELESLESSILKQEEALENDKQAAQERLNREIKRREEIASKRRFESVASYKPREKNKLADFEERYNQLTEEENEAALEKLIRARQRELRHERQRIRFQFEESLEDLYSKALDLYGSGMYEESQRLFNEVNVMAKGYKKTNEYLRKIEEMASQNQQFHPTQNNYGQNIIKPSARQLKTRDEMIAGALDSLDRSNY